MPPLDRLLAFAAAAFAIIIVPGPSVLFVISRAVALGRKAAVATVVGNALGVYLQVIAVAFGVGAVVERSAAVFDIIRLAGAGYIVLLGIRAVRHRQAMAGVFSAVVEVKSTRRIVREGFVVGITNPKVIVFMAAILPQFVDPDRGGVPAQMLVLGLVFVLIALASDGAWGMAAGTARTWLARSPKRLSALGGAGGAVMIGLGVRLALTGRHD